MIKCTRIAGQSAKVGHGVNCPRNPKYVRPTFLIIGSRVIVIPS